MADFCTNLKQLRKQAKLSQDSLAEQLCVSRQTVSSWERGKSYPDLDMLVQLSQVLHSTPNELLFPPAKNNKLSPCIHAVTFRNLAIAVFAAGFLWGLSEGSQAYAPIANTVGWHFVFSSALPYWGGAFLTGMAFLGIAQILALLYAHQESE